MALLSEDAIAYTCRTGFGLIEVPSTEGFSPGDNVVKKAIQRTKKAIGGQSGKVVSVLVRDDELEQKGNYSELISLSQTSIETQISSSDFAQIIGATRQQINSLEGQIIKGMKFGKVVSDSNYYFNTLEISSEDNSTSAFTIMGGVFLRGYLYSVVAHTSSATGDADRSVWTAKCTAWIKRLVAENAKPAASSQSSPQLATVVNIDDYALAGITLEKTERVRTKGLDGPETIDVKFEYPKSMKKVDPLPGSFFAVEREVDGYAFRLEISETHYDASLDAALDGLAGVKDDAADEMAKALAPRLAAADDSGNAQDTLAAGAIAVDGHNAVWRTSWRPAKPGSTGSGAAARTVWLPAADCRALKMEFTLRDTTTQLVPVADIEHFNVIMAKAATSIDIQNKKQFKKK